MLRSIQKISTFEMFFRIYPLVMVQGHNQLLQWLDMKTFRMSFGEVCELFM